MLSKRNSADGSSSTYTANEYNNVSNLTAVSSSKSSEDAKPPSLPELKLDYTFEGDNLTSAPQNDNAIHCDYPDQYASLERHTKNEAQSVAKTSINRASDASMTNVQRSLRGEQAKRDAIRRSIWSSCPCEPPALPQTVSPHFDLGLQDGLTHNNVAYLKAAPDVLKTFDNVEDFALPRTENDHDVSAIRDVSNTFSPLAPILIPTNSHRQPMRTPRQVKSPTN